MIFGRLIESVQKSVLNKQFKQGKLIPYKIYELKSTKAKEYYKYISEIKTDSYKKYGDGIVLVTKDTEDFIGYLIVYKYWCLTGDSNSKYGGNFISPLIVSKKYRGMGFGTILLKYAIEKYNCNILTVYDDNEVAIKLYESHGFKKVDTIKNKGLIIMLRGENRHKE